MSATDDGLQVCQKQERTVRAGNNTCVGENDLRYRPGLVTCLWVPHVGLVLCTVHFCLGWLVLDLIKNPIHNGMPFYKCHGNLILTYLLSVED